MDSAAIRLKRLREAAVPRLSVRKLAELLEMPASSYAFYEDPKKFKKQYIPVELAKALAEPLTGHGLDLWDVLALAGLEERLDPTDLATPHPSAAGKISLQAQHDLIEDLDLVPIGEIDLAYGMGGTFSDIPVEVTIHHFPRLWIESITRGPPPLLTLARGKGDSMEPTIKDGDMVIINRAERVIREQDAIWAMTMGDIAMMKRVRIRGERVTILSDNERVPPDEVHVSEINVVGRVDFVGSRK